MTSRDLTRLVVFPSISQQKSFVYSSLLYYYVSIIPLVDRRRHITWQVWSAITKPSQRCLLICMLSDAYHLRNYDTSSCNYTTTNGEFQFHCCAPCPFKGQSQASLEQHTADYQYPLDRYCVDALGHLKHRLILKLHYRKIIEDNRNQQVSSLLSFIRNRYILKHFFDEFLEDRKRLSYSTRFLVQQQHGI